MHFLNVENDFKKYLDRSDVKEKFEEKRVSSRAAKVGFYLKDKCPHNEITSMILSLHRNQNWKEIIDYRNIWVHKQPPIVKGSGIQRKRQSNDKRKIKLMNNQYDHTIEELVAKERSVVTKLNEVLERILQVVIQKREALGETLDTDNRKVTFQFF